MWYRAVRPALFAVDPERAHRLALRALRLAGNRPQPAPSSAPVELLGLRFPNRVGLAAGFDKNAAAVDGLGSLGFGFIEVGTVTPRAQAGQPMPRLFRRPARGALINRLGFPNDGAATVAARLRRYRFRGVIGVNIGKNANTSDTAAVDDYVSCMRSVLGVADYVAVNVSSPNTSGLRQLQRRERLEPLLSALLQVRAESALNANHNVPLLLKISPDLSESELLDVAAILKRLSIDGVIATNTTLNAYEQNAGGTTETGGISGRPLQLIALRVVTELRKLLGPSYPIIGVGGIDSPQAALAMRRAGADLIQLYTGLIYQGPALISQCCRALGRHGWAR